MQRQFVTKYRLAVGLVSPRKQQHRQASDTLETIQPKGHSSDLKCGQLCVRVPFTPAERRELRRSCSASAKGQHTRDAGQSRPRPPPVGSRSPTERRQTVSRDDPSPPHGEFVNPRESHAADAQDHVRHSRFHRWSGDAQDHVRFTAGAKMQWAFLLAFIVCLVHSTERLLSGVLIPTSFLIRQRKCDECGCGVREEESRPPSFRRSRKRMSRAALTAITSRGPNGRPL